MNYGWILQCAGIAVMLYGAEVRTNSFLFIGLGIYFVGLFIYILTEAVYI